LAGAISFGVRMNAFTPPSVVGSMLTPSFSRACCRSVAVAAALARISSFHSAALLGLALQDGLR
jgi:hypothetical protein